MPYKFAKIKFKSPFLDKRTKLLPCHKERIRALSAEGYSLRELGAMFKVSHSMIAFVVDPNRKIQNDAARESRGGSKIYYDRKQHTESTRNHRQRKAEIFNKTGIHITPTKKK